MSDTESQPEKVIRPEQDVENRVKEAERVEHGEAPSDPDPNVVVQNEAADRELARREEQQPDTVQVNPPHGEKTDTEAEEAKSRRTKS